MGRILLIEEIPKALDTSINNSTVVDSKAKVKDLACVSVESDKEAVVTLLNVSERKTVPVKGAKFGLN